MSTTLRDIGASILRTVVPSVVGLALTWLAVHFHIVLNDSTAEAAKLTAAAALITLYYAGVRWLEARWPKVGILLGLPVQPKYDTAALPARNQGGFAVPTWLAVLVGILAVLLILWLLGHPARVS